MSFKKKILMFAICVMLAPSVVANAAVYLSPYPHAVDSGGHLDWDYSAKYYNECVNAQNTWNAYRSGVIRKDTISIIEDIFVKDFNQNSTLAGVYYPYDRVIGLNEYHFSRFSTRQKQAVVLHEFGHTLGLGENSNRLAAIMQNEVFHSNTSLHQDDKDSYDAAAKNY